MAAPIFKVEQESLRHWILRHCRDRAMTGWYWCNATSVCDAVGIIYCEENRYHIKNAVTSLLRKGLLTKTGAGRTYTISRAGLELLWDFDDFWEGWDAEELAG